MEEKCPRCESLNWEVDSTNNTCFCKSCKGFFSSDSVKRFWSNGGIKLSKHEAYAEIGGNYRKPSVLIEDGEFSFRCPICRTKHLTKEQAKECINSCWKKVKTIKKTKCI